MDDQRGRRTTPGGELERQLGRHDRVKEVSIAIGIYREFLLIRSLREELIAFMRDTDR